MECSFYNLSWTLNVNNSLVTVYLLTLYLYKKLPFSLSVSIGVYTKYVPFDSLTVFPAIDSFSQSQTGVEPESKFVDI